MKSGVVVVGVVWWWLSLWWWLLWWWWWGRSGGGSGWDSLMNGGSCNRLRSPNGCVKKRGC